ncbi:CLUMA_CG017382, isoform A [Clunio marinus]|uniref:CLUMA_CG017382, isoform A n=1 Tax=Clunio marinus TaxID=568069 RepID=A0A1J1IXI5_9DIPT|nr:CLUMA_CG017382, isoform A [Clunio marinus]
MFQIAFLLSVVILDMKNLRKKFLYLPEIFSFCREISQIDVFVYITYQKSTIKGFPNISKFKTFIRSKNLLKEKAFMITQME